MSDEADPETAPEPVVAEAQAEEAAPTTDQDADEAMDVEDEEDTTPEPDDSTEDVNTADISPDNEEPDDEAPDNQEPDGESSAINTATAEESDDVEPEALEPVDAEDQDDMSEDDDAEDINSEDISAVDADESSVAAAALLRSNQSRPEKSRRAPPWMPKSARSTVSPAEARKAIVNRPSPAEAKRANQTSRLSPRQGVCDSLSNRSRRAGSRPDLGRGLSGKRPSWIQSKC